MKLESLALQEGYSSEPTTKAAAVPIYQTTSFAFKNSEHGANLFALKEFGNIYTRIMNPTNDVLEKRIAALEGGTSALAVSSGQAAQLLAITNIAHAGDNFVSSQFLYGGTYNQFKVSFKRIGIEVRFAEKDDVQSYEKLIDEKTKAIYLETIGNPGFNVPDFEKFAALAQTPMALICIVDAAHSRSGRRFSPDLAARGGQEPKRRGVSHQHQSRRQLFRSCRLDVPRWGE